MNREIISKDTTKIENGWYELAFPSGAVQFIYVQENSECECDYTIYELRQNVMSEVDGGIIENDFDKSNLWLLKEFIYGELFEETGSDLSKVTTSLLLDDNGQVIDDFEEGYELIEKGA